MTRVERNVTEDWEARATDFEKETCPKCGIARYWLSRAHPKVRPMLDRCGDPFHQRVEPVSAEEE